MIIFLNLQINIVCIYNKLFYLWVFVHIFHLNKYGYIKTNICCVGLKMHSNILHIQKSVLYTLVYLKNISNTVSIWPNIK